MAARLATRPVTASSPRTRTRLPTRGVANGARGRDAIDGVAACGPGFGGVGVAGDAAGGRDGVGERALQVLGARRVAGFGVEAARVANGLARGGASPERGSGRAAVAVIVLSVPVHAARWCLVQSATAQQSRSSRLTCRPALQPYPRQTTAPRTRGRQRKPRHDRAKTKPALPAPLDDRPGWRRKAALSEIPGWLDVTDPAPSAAGADGCGKSDDAGCCGRARCPLSRRLRLSLRREGGARPTWLVVVLVVVVLN